MWDDLRDTPPVRALESETTGGADEASQLPARVERYSKARRRARQILGHIEHEAIPQASEFVRYRLVKAAQGLRDCGEYLVFRHYYTAAKVRLHAMHSCKQHLLCPLCAIRRGAKALGVYLDRFTVVRASQPLLRPFMVTFTVKNGPDLFERFNHLSTAFKRVRHHAMDSRRRGWGSSEWVNVQGYVGSYEFTNKGKGWHPHLHLICLCETPPDQATLAAQWHAITGDSFIVDVREMDPVNPLGGFLEVFKYAMKFSDLEPALTVEAFLSLASRRLLISGGAFRGVKVPESLTDEPLDNLPYVQLFYRYTDSAGYALSNVSDLLPASA